MAQAMILENVLIIVIALFSPITLLYFFLYQGLLHCAFFYFPIVVSKLRGSKLMGMLYLISITKLVCMVNFFGLNDRYICILHDLGDILEV